MANSKKITICLGVDFESKPILSEDGIDALYKQLYALAIKNREMRYARSRFLGERLRKIIIR